MAILAHINNQITQSWDGLKRNFSKGEDLALSAYLDPLLILFLEAESRDDALEQMVASLQKAGRLQNVSAFHKAVLNREKIVSTGVGLGVAIPHAKLEGHENFFIVIGIQRGQGLEWSALDGAPVRLIFLIGGPGNKQTEYLKILSRLTVAVKNEERRKKLLKASSVQEIFELFSSN